MCFGSDNSNSNVHPAGYTLDNSHSAVDTTVTGPGQKPPDGPGMVNGHPDDTGLLPANRRPQRTGTTNPTDTAGGLTRPMGM